MVKMYKRRNKIKSKSIEMLINAAFKIHFIGETANNKLNVIMVGITTATSVRVFSIAPRPTVSPPRHPTTVRIIAIHPKRLNSRLL